MNDIFRRYLRQLVLVFFDDILIYSSDVNTHMEHLEAVLVILQENHLVINLKKCNFIQPRIEYLGHIISSQGVQADLTKVESMLA